MDAAAAAMHKRKRMDGWANGTRTREILGFFEQRIRRRIVSACLKRARVAQLSFMLFSNLGSVREMGYERI